MASPVTDCWAMSQLLGRGAFTGLWTPPFWISSLNIIILWKLLRGGIKDKYKEVASLAQGNNLQVWSDVDNKIGTEEGKHKAVCRRGLCSREVDYERILRLATCDHHLILPQFFSF